MAEVGRRDVVGDPLASNPNASTPARALGLDGVQNPNQSGGQLSDGSLVQLLGGVQTVLGQMIEKKADEEITRGKIAFMSGVTESGLIQSGNKYTAQGFEALHAADTANKWYQEELLNIDGAGQEEDPAQYQKNLMVKRAAYLADLPDDPAVKKVYAAAFEDLAPRLAAQQVQANSAFNKGQQINKLSLALSSTGDVGVNTPRPVAGSALPVSAGFVSAPVTVSEIDRDNGIRTMLGEAANQGDVGLSAVAWNLRNRKDNGSWGDSITSVSRADNQYSAWNATDNGGNDLVSKYGPGTPQYERAGRVFDAVMGGHTIDPTGGALNYLSKSGMAAAGDPLPSWYTEQVEAGAVEINIGGHTFLAKPGTNTATAENYGTEVQQTLAAFGGLRGPDKAAALSGALQLQLDQGKVTLWDAIGGMAGLHDLQATPEQLQAVWNARQRYDATQANKYNQADEAERQGLLTGIADGSISQGQAEAWIAERYDSGKLSDADATALTRQAYAQVDQVYKSPASVDPAFMQEISGLYQNMATDLSIDQVQMAKLVQTAADKYGVEPKAVDAILGNMAQIDTSRQASATNDVAAAVAKKAKEDGIKGAVNQALGDGTGLGAVTGKVSVPNNDGTISEVSAQDWGVMKLRHDIAATLSFQVQTGAIANDEAAAQLDLKLYSALAKQGVPDTKFGAAITAAVTGKIVGTDGLPTQAAIDAYDWYKRMSNSPEVGGAYVSTMVTDPYTRTLLETVKTLDTGRGDPREAIAKAYEFMSNPNTDTAYRVSQDKGFNDLLSSRLDQFLTQTTKTGFADWVFTGRGSYSAADQEAIKSPANEKAALLYLQKQAQANYIRFPQAAPEAHIQQAIQDLQANMRIIGSNIIIGQNGRTVQDDMGLSGMTPDAPAKAVTYWLEQNMQKVADESGWGANYSALRAPLVDIPLSPTVGAQQDIFGKDIPGSGSGLRIKFGNADTSSRLPPYTLNYNSTTGLMEVRFWSDAERTNVIGSPIVLDADKLGQEYLEYTRKPDFFSTLGVMLTGGAASINRAAIAKPDMPEYGTNPMQQSLYGVRP